MYNPLHMTSAKILIIAIISLVIFFFVIAASADDCGCNAEPDGGWGAPDYTNDPSWGSSFDDLTGGGGSSTDTGGSDSGSSGVAGDSSSGDSSGGSSSGTDSSSSSSDTGSSSGMTGGSSEEGVVWRIKADDLALKGMYNESLEAYEKSITYDPYALRSWIGKGKVLLSLERPSEAADAFTRAIRLDPGNTDVLSLLGDAQNASGAYDDAISSYTKALAMNPNLAGMKDKIALSEEARTLASAPNSPNEAEIAVVAAAQETIAVENETAPVSPVESPTQPVTPKVSFPGLVTLILVFGMGSLLMWIRKK
jgi:tetratricopeptide (TPR) repeat protein